ELYIDQLIMGERMLSKAENLVGRQLAGYRLLEILGRGGMSIVFLAERLDNPQERVAIKVLMLSHVPTSEEFISFQTRFLREAQTVHQSHHEHILPVLGYGEVDDILYMIMPLITGATLAELLALKHDPLPFAEPATDIYALGILLYQLVTGQVPFKADSPLVVGMKHLNEMPLSPRSLRPDLPEPAEAAMLRALAKQPADRFATASALAAAFDAG